MLEHQSLAFVHILLMVFWIGTDLGVFIAGFYFMNAGLSLGQRRTAIELGLVIDRFPRLCFAAIVPVGAQLAYEDGLLPVSPTTMSAVWAAGLVWLAAVVIGMLRPGTKLAQTSHALERVFQIASLVGLGGAGAAGLAGALPLVPWLAAKLLAFGLICLFVILLELSFGPALAAFEIIAEQGSEPAREAALRRAMWATYVWVIGIYAAVLAAGYLGTTRL